MAPPSSMRCTNPGLRRVTMRMRWGEGHAAMLMLVLWLSRVVMLLFVLGMLAFGTVSAPQAAGDRAASSADRSLLKIVAVDVQPAHPGPDTLCKLRVRFRNSGRDSASDLSFQVTVNGQRLGNYINHTFRSALEPGKETDLPLFNFWSSEAGRPYPGDGRLVIEVRLMGARWVDARSTNAATLAGGVEPLPAPFSVTLTQQDKR